MTRLAQEGTPLGCDEEAADWCLRLADGDLGERDREAFDAWIADPKRRAAFEEAVAVWQGVENLGPQPEMIHIRAEALDHYRRAHAKRWAPARLAGWRRYAAVAAALLVAVLVGLTVYHPAQVYETGIGERRVAILDDGSKLSLDAATRVEVRMSRDRRELKLLKGRAKFDVVGRPLRPFSVAAGDKIVVAVGTSFSVELVNSQMHVVLYEGHVKILEQAAKGMGAERTLLSPSAARTETARPGEWALEPGRELIASITAPVTREAPADLAGSLSWEAGQLTFIDEPLSLAAERLNRYSARKLVIADRAAGQLKVNGVFKAGDTGAFAEGVAAVLPVQVRQQSDQILLTSR